MEHIEQVNEKIYSIDQQWLDNVQYNSCYLIAGERVALYDTGPTTSMEKVLQSVEELGFRPEDISCLIYSHIHIDHAGSAGVFSTRYPHLQVLVHEQGAPHLANPEKLYQSMKRVFGEMAEKMYGDVVPVPEEQLRPLADGEIIDLGGVQLRVLHTPGHASHHLCLYDDEHRVLFAGEALGIYLPEADVYFPSTPPPDFDLVSAVNSVEKLEKLPVEKVLFSHFGPAGDPVIPLKKAKEMLIDWGRIVYQAMSERDDTAYVLEKLSEESMKCIEHLRDAPELYRKYTELVRFRSGTTCGPGYIRYFKKGGVVL